MQTNVEDRKMQENSTDREYKVILEVLFSHKIKIISSTFIFGIIALVLSIILPYKYEAKTTFFIKESNVDGGGGMSNIASQLGGVASMLNFDVGGGNSQKDLRIALLRSQQYSYKFIKKNDLVKVFFASLWDEDTQTWKVDADEDMPTIWNAYEYFNKKVRFIEEDKLSGLLTLTIKWKDPEVSKNWANQIVSDADVAIRKRDKEETQRSLAFLQSQLSNATIREVRQSLAQLIQVELQKLVMVNAQNQYAFITIDNAIKPDLNDPVWPKKIIFIPLGILLGMLFGILLALISDFRLLKLK